MARAGLTNFLVWAVAVMVVSLLWPTPIAVIAAAGAALIAWFTRYWQEALGALTGLAAAALLLGLFRAGVHGSGAGGFFVFGFATALVGAVLWRLRVADGSTPAPPRQLTPASTPARLSAAAVLGAIVLLVINFVLALGFGFACGSDTNPGPDPGSDKGAYCDMLSGANGDLWILVVLAPPLAVLLFGLAAASQRQARGVLITIVVGFAVVVALHIPDFVLSSSA